MYLTSDKRKPWNLGIFTVIWLLSMLLFGYQSNREKNDIEAQWDGLTNRLVQEAKQAQHYDRELKDPEYLVDSMVDQVGRFAELKPAEITKVRDWLKSNIKRIVVGQLDDQKINEALTSLKPLIISGIERRFPTQKNRHEMLAWIGCVVLYTLVILGVYLLSPLPAIETEAPLNVLDVGFIGTALQISGGLGSPRYAIWVVFFVCHGVVVAYDISRPPRQVAKHVPYFFAFLVAFFWATFQGNLSLEYLKDYSFVVGIVLFVVVLVFFLFARTGVEARSV